MSLSDPELLIAKGIAATMLAPDRCLPILIRRALGIAVSNDDYEAAGEIARKRLRGLMDFPQNLEIFASRISNRPPRN